MKVEQETIQVHGSEPSHDPEYGGPIILTIGIITMIIILYVLTKQRKDGK